MKKCEVSFSTLPVTAPSSDRLLELALEERAARFDESVDLVSSLGASPGYHTKVKAGQKVHPTLDSTQYAHLLLMRGDAADVRRAIRILHRVLDLQVTDPASIHYGIWGWFAEEPPEQMAPADWNWADFIGARLAEILHAHAGALEAALVERARAGLRHAANAIVKRDIGPHYTNICAMGAAVTLAAGEILADRELVAYGRRRLAAQRAALDANGGVPEYNSPHYGAVFILELERVLRLVSDTAARDDADAMRRRVWELTASQFHPRTGQWAGAQSRVYADWLTSEPALLIWRRAGIRPAGAEHMTFCPNPDLLHEGPELACPPEICHRFDSLQAPLFEQVQTWMVPAADKPAVVLRTWFSDEATLGSVNISTTWVQHRPVTAYWRDSSGGVASAKVVFLKDGREFASGRLRIVQSGPRLLVVLSLAAGQGDWHVSLDRPEDGCFTASDLRLRVLLASDAGQLVFEQEAGPWALVAGRHRLVVHPGTVHFEDTPGLWVPSGDGLHVDAVLHSGAPRTFAAREISETCVSLGLELLSADEKATSAPVACTVSEGKRTWRWDAVPGGIQSPH